MPVIRTCTNCGQKNRIPAAHLADTGKCGNCKSAIGPVHEPIEVDTALFDEIVQNARVPVLADFWAAWCGPCRMAAPEVATAAGNMSGQAVVIKVNTERHPDLAWRFQIRGIPYFAVFYGGAAIVQQPGLVDHEQMEHWLRSAAPVSAA